MNYISSPSDSHAHSQENLPAEADQPRTKVAKKVNRKRLKSRSRDAKFRPLFQAVAALEELHAGTETSVTYATPSHPHYPILRLTRALSVSQRPGTPAFVSETLTDEELLREARYWRGLIAETRRQYRKPAEWRDLSDEARLEWFHHGLRSGGAVTGFTLHFDADVEAKVRAHPESADWLSKRIARRLKDALSRKVPFWFAFEVSPAPERKLHVHGELQVAEHELEAVRKALRLAGGEWDEVRQHQAHTKPDPSRVWVNYAAKDAIWMKPKRGRLGNLPRPINGDWYYRSNEVASAAQKLYAARRELVIVLMEQIASK